MPERVRAEVERELMAARAALARLWPSELPTMAFNRAPSAEAREALQLLIRLQNELDSLGDDEAPAD
jgi:hypothetical protein